jgi:ABC-type bacteriocin/lantibiotic exporter with double-glycine peptidase domain
LKNISFRYSGKKDVIHAIDLKIQAGEKIALLGRSGQGKTTLLSIILGLID